MIEKGSLVFIPSENKTTEVHRVFDDAIEDCNFIFYSNNEFIELPTTPIKDSGERTEFTTGAVRDMAKGKGLMVVMPFEALLRLSRHYEAGAEKYGRWNYDKGIPVSSLADSAVRHLTKYLAGCDDEDHLSACAFNILGAMQMENTKPELIDIPKREGKKTFNYFEGCEK